MEEWRDLVLFEEKVAVIYTLYCLYKIQCLQSRLLIHLPVESLQLIVSILPKLAEAEIKDALYIFKDLWENVIN